MKIEAVFIDRDGTIGGNDQVIYPGAFSLYPFVSESIKLLKKEGMNIYSFTNQPGISRGEALAEDFRKELKSFGFDHVYIYMSTFPQRRMPVPETKNRNAVTSCSREPSEARKLHCHW